MTARWIDQARVDGGGLVAQHNGPYRISAGWRIRRLRRGALRLHRSVAAVDQDRTDAKSSGSIMDRLDFGEKKIKRGMLLIAKAGHSRDATVFVISMNTAPADRQRMK